MKTVTKNVRRNGTGEEKISETSFAGTKHDLYGYAALDFINPGTLDEFAQSFAGCNTTRFKPLAIRLFVKSGKPVITLYALDKAKKEQQPINDDTIPVRKFKAILSFDDFLKQIKQFDFTVMLNGVDVEKFLVMNK